METTGAVHVFIDLETTGLVKEGQNPDQPLEIGLVVECFLGNHAIALREYNWFIRLPREWYEMTPTRSIAQEIHHISHDILAQATETQQTTVDRLLEVIQSAVIEVCNAMRVRPPGSSPTEIIAETPGEKHVAVMIFSYNGLRFDTYFLDRMFEACNHAELPRRWKHVDVFQHVMHAYKPDKWLSLTDAYQRFTGKEATNAHSALGDCRLTRELWDFVRQSE